MTDEDVRRAIEEVAADVLREERATLRADADGLSLRPRNTSACPVHFDLQSEEEVSLVVGRHGTIVDIYNRDPACLLKTLRDFVSAIIDGRYEEEVRLGTGSQDGKLGKARGVFHLNEGDRCITYSNLATLGTRGPPQRITYEAYWIAPVPFLV